MELVDSEPYCCHSEPIADAPKRVESVPRNPRLILRVV